MLKHRNSLGVRKYFIRFVTIKGTVKDKLENNILEKHLNYFYLLNYGTISAEVLYHIRYFCIISKK